MIPIQRKHPNRINDQLFNERLQPSDDRDPWAVVEDGDRHNGDGGDNNPPLRAWQRLPGGRPRAFS